MIPVSVILTTSVKRTTRRSHRLKHMWNECVTEPGLPAGSALFISRDSVSVSMSLKWRKESWRHSAPTEYLKVKARNRVRE